MKNGELKIEDGGLRVKDRKIQNIQERTFDFSCRIVRLYKFMLRQSRSNEIVCRQLLKAGTSIGANLEEACAAQSRADFISKCNIALKEARETRYWLRLFLETEILPKSRLEGLIGESNEILAILTAIVKKSRSNSKV